MGNFNSKKRKGRGDAGTSPPRIDLSKESSFDKLYYTPYSPAKQSPSIDSLVTVIVGALLQKSDFTPQPRKHAFVIAQKDAVRHGYLVHRSAVKKMLRTDPGLWRLFRAVEKKHPARVPVLVALDDFEGVTAIDLTIDWGGVLGDE